MSPSPAGSGARRVIVLGGTSEIALAIVHELQTRGPLEVALVGRDGDALAGAAERLRANGASQAITLELDALETERHAVVVNEAFARLGGGEIVILAVGALGERGGLPAELDGAVDVLEVNLVGAGSLMLHAAHAMQERGGGRLVVLSSVAAERPRRASVVYGASKAGLDALARGLGDALYEDGVGVLLVRPGFVHTRMTRGLPPAPLSSTPEAVGRAVADGLERGAHTIWVPSTLRWLMILVRMLPRRVFRRIKR